MEHAAGPNNDSPLQRDCSRKPEAQCMPEGEQESLQVDHSVDSQKVLGPSRSMIYHTSHTSTNLDCQALHVGALGRALPSANPCRRNALHTANALNTGNALHKGAPANRNPVGASALEPLLSWNPYPVAALEEASVQGCASRERPCTRQPRQVPVGATALEPVPSGNSCRGAQQQDLEVELEADMMKRGTGTNTHEHITSQLPPTCDNVASNSGVLSYDSMLLH